MKTLSWMIVQYKPSYFEEYFDLGRGLFPDDSKGQLGRGLEYVTGSGKHRAFLAVENGELSAFANVSVRADYVEGDTASPLGYLEALCVKPEYRKIGVAGIPARMAASWALPRGCTQMGSDTWKSHLDGITFHHKWGIGRRIFSSILLKTFNARKTDEISDRTTSHATTFRGGHRRHTHFKFNGRRCPVQYHWYSRGSQGYENTFTAIF